MKKQIELILAKLAELDLDALGAISRLIADSAGQGGTVFVIGNGGSASIAQHLVCDLMNLGKPARSLSDNQSVLTALANDHGYETVFKKQLEILARPKDVLLCFSASGSSPNIRTALVAAREKSLYTVLISGKETCRCDQALCLDVVDPKMAESLFSIIAHLLVGKPRLE